MQLVRALLLAAIIPLWAGDAPQISDAQRAKYWRAQAEAIATQARAEKALAVFQAVQAELVKACGGRQLIGGPDGEPACAPATDSK